MMNHNKKKRRSLFINFFTTSPYLFDVDNNGLNPINFGKYFFKTGITIIIVSEVAINTNKPPQ